MLFSCESIFVNLKFRPIQGLYEDTGNPQPHKLETKYMGPQTLILSLNKQVYFYGLPCWEFTKSTFGAPTKNNPVYYMTKIDL